MSNNVRTEIREVDAAVRACERYWKRTNVPGDAIREMRLELEGHLDEAVADGKALGSVIGKDVESFAEGWAREYRLPYIRSSSWVRAAPALLALLGGGWMLWMSSGIATSMEYVRECCPWTVMEQATETTIGGELLYRLTIAAAALSILAAVLLLVGQFAWGSAALALAAIAAAIMPPGWVVSLTLIAALVWTLWVLRRAYRRKTSPLAT